MYFTIQKLYCNFKVKYTLGNVTLYFGTIGNGISRPPNGSLQFLKFQYFELSKLGLPRRN